MHSLQVSVLSLAHSCCVCHSNCSRHQVPAIPVVQGSILGLDRLAAAKRKQAEEQREMKKSRISSYMHDDDEEVEEDDNEIKGTKHRPHKER